LASVVANIIFFAPEQRAIALFPNFTYSYLKERGHVFMQQIGFIGTGHMGLPIARNLLAAGYALRVYDIRPEQVAPLVALGATAVQRPGDAVEPGGIVVSMVPNDAVLHAIVEGEHGILEQMGAGGCHVSMSTILPETARHMADLYRQRDSDFLVATVSGRPNKAAAAQLLIYMSGSRRAKQRALPLLKHLGKQVEDYGEDEAAANVVKLFANFMILASLATMGQGAALLRKAGIAPEQGFRSLVDSGLFTGDVFEGYGVKMIGRDAYAEALFPANPLGIKDADYILHLAKTLSVPLPAAEVAHAYLQEAIAEGWGDLDWSVLARIAAKEAGLLEVLA
jgi:3-hydroxyisobutyrate dehydrogenase-like beta-hydroxyacid dehydrogenase